MVDIGASAFDSEALNDSMEIAWGHHSFLVQRRLAEIVIVIRRGATCYREKTAAKQRRKREGGFSTARSRV